MKESNTAAVSLGLIYLISYIYTHRLVHGPTPTKEASFCRRWQLTHLPKSNENAENKSLSNVEH